jgi:hypothetical protein
VKAAYVDAARSHITLLQAAASSGYMYMHPQLHMLRTCVYCTSTGVHIVLCAVCRTGSCSSCAADARMKLLRQMHLQLVVHVVLCAALHVSPAAAAAVPLTRA